MASHIDSIHHVAPASAYAAGECSDIVPSTMMSTSSSGRSASSCARSSATSSRCGWRAPPSPSSTWGMTPSQLRRPGHRLRVAERADAPDRHPWLLDRVTDRRELGRRDRVVGAVVAERLAAPQPAHDVEALVHQFGAGAPVALLAEGVKSRIDRAEPDRQRHAARGDPVDGRDLAGEFPRASPRGWREQRAEANLRGADRGEAERDPGVDTPHRLPHEQPVPPGLLGRGSQIADVLGVAPRDHEAELHVVDRRPCGDRARGPKRVARVVSTPCGIGGRAYSRVR